MLPDRPIRRVSSVILGIAAIFDLTGAVVFRLLRRGLPAAAGPASGQQDRGQQTLRAGALAASAASIQSAYREAVLHGRGQDGPGTPGADAGSGGEHGSGAAADSGGVTLPG